MTTIVRMISWSALLAVFLPLVSSSPLVNERQIQTLCGKFDTVTQGPYSLLTNLWGVLDVTSGSQCSTLESVKNGIVEWSTTWKWGDDDAIKSYSNIQLNDGVNKQLSAISTMPSAWTWAQSSDGSAVANVAYDFFTSYTAGGSNVIEVMVWLAKFNAGPICFEYDSGGQPTPIASNLEINGYRWNLHLGSNGYNLVYSFLPTSGNVDHFSGDMYKFFSHLIDKGHVDASQYLKIAQAGTEATSGSATFRTLSYHLSVS